MKGGGDDEDGDPSGPSSAARPPTHNGPSKQVKPIVYMQIIVSTMYFCFHIYISFVGQDEQPAALRPRSKRQKKLSIKGMYMLEKVKYI